ncbi:hypothetical protein [Prosthecochloris sp.]|uniref:hypothetical protein n=1 Tax=Prosthecochloris sp. TaxID=290513 RepID=UPI00257CD6A5|nr:hypothetical protein [Prosthecochloris sp.]
MAVKKEEDKALGKAVNDSVVEAESKPVNDVVATTPGFYGGVYIEEGQRFRVPEGSVGSWFKTVQ